VQLVKALARELELGVEFRDTGFETIFTDLSRGKFDLVASATTVTPERKRVVRFTRPNYIPLQSLVTRTRSGIRSLKSLRGATVGVQRGTTGAAFAFRRLKRARIVQFSDVPTAIRALKGGRVDAVVTDQVAVRGTRRVRIVRSFSTGEKYAYAVAKASTDLLHGLNWALNRLKRNGTFGKIYRRWFGIAPPPALRYRP